MREEIRFSMMQRDEIMKNNISKERVIYFCLMGLCALIAASPLLWDAVPELFAKTPLYIVFGLAMFCGYQSLDTGFVVMFCTYYGMVSLVAVFASLAHFKRHGFAVAANIIMIVDMFFNLFSVSIVAAILDLIIIILINIIKKPKVYNWGK